MGWGVCWVVSESRLVLFVAVGTAVRRAVGLAGRKVPVRIAGYWMVISFSSMGAVS